MESTSQKQTTSPTPIGTLDTSEDHSGHHTPKVLVTTWDGQQQVVRANAFRGGRVTAACSSFFLHALILLICLVAGLILAILTGPSGGAAFNLAVAMVSFATGGFTPAPKLPKDYGRSGAEGQTSNV